MSSSEPLPACLTVEGVAQILGFARHAIPILVRVGLLRPVGSGRRNTVKFYHREAVLAHARDEQWLAQAVDAIRDHWRARNQRRRRREGPPFSPPNSTPNPIHLP